MVETIQEPSEKICPLEQEVVALTQAVDPEEDTCPTGQGVQKEAPLEE